ncbi:hypothetical protein FAVG1_05986 [Fusarium avenaceum]|nr:hypothetical protein FAVG1_05986 [Fusarium avenaceum]
MSKRNGSTSASDYTGDAHPSKRVAVTSNPDPPIAHISRHIRACTTCRKHKIKCFMDDAGPPCRRCQEKKLSNCAVSKNLQTIIDEKTELSEAMLSDIDQMYAAVKEMRTIMGMPDLPPLQISRLNKRKESTASQSLEPSTQPLPEDNYGPSCDNSPKLTPEDDRLPHAPIHSLYTLTRMRALRSPGNGNDNSSQAINDFISQGLITMADAERLFAIYRDRLDGFIYSIGCPYKTLEQLRRKSSILCAATLTIAALHDPTADKAYGVCSAELRRLTEKSMLQRQGDRDYFRALSIASYWLSDLSWTLSGHAIRRASECNIHNSYSLAIKEQSEEAMDSARIWSILYICDQHLAILYDRPAIIQDDWLTQDWEGILSSPLATDQDERLMSQVELMGILRNIRRLFGPDKGEEIPRLYLSQLGHYHRQLDQWITKWTDRLPDLSISIVGMPSYLLSMTAFAAMFLAKVSHKYGDDLFRRDQALDQITRLINHFRLLPMGKWHLANLMIRGLETVTSLLKPQGVPAKTQNAITPMLPGSANTGLQDIYGTGNDMFTSIDSSTIPTWDTTFGLSPIFGFDPSLLDVDGYMQSMAIFPNAE